MGRHFHTIQCTLHIRQFYTPCELSLIEGVSVVNANSVDGIQGELSVTLASGVEATEIAWFNAGINDWYRSSVTVDNPGTFSVQITTADCQSLFGGCCY